MGLPVLQEEPLRLMLASNLKWLYIQQDRIEELRKLTPLFINKIQDILHGYSSIENFSYGNSMLLLEVIP